MTGGGAVREGNHRLTVQPNIVLVHGAFGHLAMISHPDEVARLIEAAAKGVQAEIKWSGL
jgi:hypothetical protein